MVDVTLRVFSSLFKKIAGKLAPRLSVVLRGLVSRGCFPETWRQADVVPIPKGLMYCFFFLRNTDQFPLSRFCPRYLRGSWPSAYKDIWNLGDSFPHANLHIKKAWALVMHCSASVSSGRRL